ncbi:MAG: hypothetical protein ACD_12C00718G0004 [uncultured bacterium]|nr:MAG: hypothetical protein ACD_12C00718G0004 [uncultured bacterium]
MHKNKLRKKYIKKRKEEFEKKHISEIPLSENNRIIYVYKDNQKTSQTEIVCVSFDIKISEDWITILYYDNHHEGLLHRHNIISYNNKANIVGNDGIRRKGDWKKLLHWAIEDIKKNHIYYKKKFLSRNRSLLRDIKVEYF